MQYVFKVLSRLRVLTLQCTAICLTRLARLESEITLVSLWPRISVAVMVGAVCVLSSIKTESTYITMYSYLPD